MRNLIVFLIFVNFSIIYCEVEQKINKCASGESCIPHYECEAVTNITAKGRLTQQERAYLKSKLCNNIDRLNYFCCAGATQKENPKKPTNVNLPEPPNCGIYFSDNIVGGQKTYIDEYPWFALIEYSSGDRKKGHYCGGSLISKQFVLTAAHCNNNLPTGWRISHVRLGEWDVRTNPDCQYFENDEEMCNDPYVEIRVAQVIQHPQYHQTGAAQYNDIALLKLEREVQTNVWIKPICLPIDQSLRDLDYTAQSLEVTGFGMTETDFKSDVKLRVDIDVVAQNECKQFYGSKGVDIKNTQFCALGKDGKDSCNGDSGGPLMKFKKFPNSNIAYYMAVGLVSFGPSKCGLKDAPGIYTRISDYMDWIIENTN
ncbi:unnamed protein product [Chironomus riparius]|uniref:CLIP domain-containing serine protease n=1 Tax=Chironomus riparius TaxID=315576 RepID=A0A9N9WUU8_9DIPT|nr:unnamed protein product [Chironomus riparius]